MPDPLSRLRRFLRELRRRKVYRVAAVYLAAAFVVVQLAALAAGAFGLPPWFEPLVWVLAGLGLPLALVLAWAFEVTPEGVQRTEPAQAPEGRAAKGEEGQDRRTGYRLLLGLGALVAAAAAAWYLTADGPAPDEPAHSSGATLDSTRVAVFPFAVQGGEELSHLEEGMVELLGRALDGAGSLDSVDPKLLLGEVDRESGGELNPAAARRIAARFGAGRYVLGSVLQLGDSIRLSAAWYRTTGGEIASAEAGGGGAQELLRMVDEVARVAIADLTGGRAGHRHRLAAQTTSSVGALKAYLQGQEALRAFDFPAAMEAFSDAIERDSTFALAHYRMSLAAAWSGRASGLAVRSVRRAVELSAGLPERDRRLLRAMQAFSTGDAETAERLFRADLADHPDDPEVWFTLGDVLFHYNAARGRPVAQARDPLGAALRLDPTFNLPLLHLAHLALLEGDRSSLDSLTTGLEERRLSPRWETSLRAVRSYALSGGPHSALASRLRGEDPTGAWIAAWMLSATGEFGPVDDLLRPLTAPDRPDEIRAATLVWQADLLAARGRLEAARRKLEEVASLDSAAYWTARARQAAFPFAPETEERARERSKVRRGLAAWNAEAVPERLLPFLYLDPPVLYPAVRLHGLGLLRATAGDRAGALKTAARLESMEAPLLALSGPVDFARSVRAEVERGRDRPVAALALLEATENRAEPLFVIKRQYSGARQRYLRASLLAELGRPEEARAWYATLNGIALGDFPYLAPAHLGRARALERLGRREEAARAYRRFLDLWREADPALQPRVREAREALKRLQGAAAAGWPGGDAGRTGERGARG